VTTFDDLREALQRLEEERLVVLCNPDRLEEILEAVGREPWAHLVTVSASQFCPLDQLYVTRPMPPYTGGILRNVLG
jgi:hypothetical protein